MAANIKAFSPKIPTQHLLEVRTHFERETGGTAEWLWWEHFQGGSLANEGLFLMDENNCVSCFNRELVED